MIEYEKVSSLDGYWVHMSMVTKSCKENHYTHWHVSTVTYIWGPRAHLCELSHLIRHEIFYFVCKRVKVANFFDRNVTVAC
jgi:hypothetical protein